MVLKFLFSKRIYKNMWEKALKLHTPGSAAVDSAATLWKVVNYRWISVADNNFKTTPTTACA